VLGACPQVSSPETDIRLGHSIGTIRCMVASGLGISVLPEGALGQPYGSDLISIIPFSPPEPTRRIAMAWRTGFVRTKAIDALLEAVRAIDMPAYRRLA
jgi:LysR family transcriptional regulator, hydrogen peroxide-inducible genes activator